MTNRSFSLAPMSQSLRRVALLFGLAAVYYFAAKLGLRFAYINSSVTTIWPPTGIALAAFVLLGGLVSWSDVPRVWLTWWLGDAVGDIVIAPALMLWIGVKPAARWTRQQLWEAIALTVVTVLVTFAMFGGVFPSRHYPLTVLLWPVLIWVAFRFGPREAAGAMMIVSFTGVFRTLDGVSPFSVY